MAAGLPQNSSGASWSSFLMRLFIGSQCRLHDIGVQPIEQPCFVLANTLVQHVGVLVLDAHSHTQSRQKELRAAAKTDQQNCNDDEGSVHNQSFVRAPSLLDLQRQHQGNATTETGVPHHEHVRPTDFLHLIVFGFETGPLDGIAHPSKRVHGARAGNEQQRNHHNPKQKPAGGLNEGHTGSDDDKDTEVSHLGASLKVEVNLLSGCLVLEMLSAVGTHDNSPHQHTDNATEVNRLSSCKHGVGRRPKIESHQHGSVPNLGDSDHKCQEETKQKSEQDGPEQKHSNLLCYRHIVYHQMPVSIGLDSALIEYIEQHNSDCIINRTLTEHKDVQQRIHIQRTVRGQRCNRVHSRNQRRECKRRLQTNHGVPPQRRSGVVHHIPDNKNRNHSSCKGENQDVVELRSEMLALQEPARAKNNDRKKK
mmetsp:Transcript_54314/g.119087  ORF Transcript_54314/g.119087 Transcript_54314/m.119087 type:complete len:422 (-) Transcript_54314:665-1930(-)